MDGSIQFLHSKSGNTQGCSLDMITYGIGILPLINFLCITHPHATQPWYTDDAGAGRSFYSFQDNMRDLLVRGPPQGYFLNPTNIIFVVSLRNSQKLEKHFHKMVVRVVTRSRYLGGFISDLESEKTLLVEKLAGWMHLVEVLVGVLRRQP